MEKKCKWITIKSYSSPKEIKWLKGILFYKAAVPGPNSFYPLTYWNMSEVNAGGTVETPTVEDLQASLAKAEAKIVDLKKNSTKEEETTPTTPKKEEVADDAVKYSKEELDAIVAEKLKEAAVVTQEETYEQNQAQTNSMSVSGEGAAPVVATFAKISIQDYDKLSQAEQNSYYSSCIEKTGELDFA